MLLIPMHNYTLIVISGNDKNKQLTLLSQCKHAFTGRNTLMVVSVNSEGHLKKYIKKARRLFRPISIHLGQQKPNPVRETVPLMFK
jgi:hypothetical protein